MKNSQPWPITKKNYPIKDEHRKHYARIPVQVTKEMQKNWPYKIAVGKWVPVNIHISGGYSHIGTPIGCGTEALCQHGCDIHNLYHGWNKFHVDQILKLSFQNNPEKP